MYKISIIFYVWRLHENSTSNHLLQSQQTLVWIDSALCMLLCCLLLQTPSTCISYTSSSWWTPSSCLYNLLWKHRTCWTSLLSLLFVAYFDCDNPDQQQYNTAWRMKKQRSETLILAIDKIFKDQSPLQMAAALFKAKKPPNLFVTV